jgi:hypothetical protein
MKEDEVSVGDTKVREVGQSKEELTDRLRKWIAISQHGCCRSMSLRACSPHCITLHAFPYQCMVLILKFLIILQ